MKMAIAAVLVASAVTAPEAKYFRYQRPIQTTAQGQACVALDSPVFAHSKAELADVRVLRAGAQVPFAVWTAASAQAPQTIPLLNLGRESGDTVFDAAMSEGGYSDIELAVSGHDFIAKVTVTGKNQSAERKETALGDFTIFDLTRQKLGRSTVLHLPESNFAMLHFRVSGPLAPADFSGLTVQRQQVKQQRYVTVTESSTPVLKDHSAVYEFYVPANVPVDRVLINPAGQSSNFSRAIEVSVSPIGPRRTTSTYDETAALFAGTLLRVHTQQAGRRIDEERLAIDTPAADRGLPSKWQVSIDNGDDAPIAVRSVAVQMVERDLCMEAGPGTALYYGDPALPAPRYDYAALFQHQQDAATLEMGPEQLNPLYQPRPDQRPVIERHPVFLWIATVLVIMLLAGIALKSARRGAE